MGQTEVYEYLKQEKEWKTLKEICSFVDSNKSSVIHSIHMLLKWHEIERKRIVVEKRFISYYRIAKKVKK